MANPFSVNVVNLLQALMMGEEGYKSQQQSGAREKAAQAMMSGDPNASRSAIAMLMGIGDMQGANTIANLGNNERDFQFRQTESNRQQGNADRSFGNNERDFQFRQAESNRQQGNADRSLGNNERDFQFRQAESNRQQGNADRSFGLQVQAANAPQIKTVKGANGEETLVHIGRDGSAKPINTGVDGTPANPYAAGGKGMNESQSKDALYARRMFTSEKVLRQVESVGSDWWERNKGTISDKVGYNIRGPEYQKFDQAQRDFINATLRRESGAVINPDEFTNANKQYFPQPGDTKEVIGQKRKNREEAIRGIAAGAGPSYRPDNIFDPSGNIVTNPTPQKSRAPVRVGSSAERDALPSGTPYIAPDGSLRTKQ